MKRVPYRLTGVLLARGSPDPRFYLIWATGREPEGGGEGGARCSILKDL